MSSKMKNIIYRTVQSNGHTAELERVDEDIVLTAFVADREGVQVDVVLDLDDVTSLIEYLERVAPYLTSKEERKGREKV